MSLSLIAFSRSIEVYTLYVVSILGMSHYYYYNIYVFVCVCFVSQHSSFDYLSIICAIVIATTKNTNLLKSNTLFLQDEQRINTTISMIIHSLAESLNQCGPN